MLAASSDVQHMQKLCQSAGWPDEHGEMMMMIITTNRDKLILRVQGAGSFKLPLWRGYGLRFCKENSLIYSAVNLKCNQQRGIHAILLLSIQFPSSCSSYRIDTGNR